MFLLVWIHNRARTIDLTKIAGFDWDDGNARKKARHGVSMAEAEWGFFNEQLLMVADTNP